MIYTRTALVLLAEAEAIKQEIDPAIVCAVIEVMSEWHPELIIPNTDSYAANPGLAFASPAEQILHASCLGLTQVLGSQARSLGYKQTSDQLLAPELNLEVGIKVLKNSLGQGNNRLDRALTLMYGYRVNSQVRKIFSKVEPYRKFLASESRPDVLSV